MKKLICGSCGYSNPTPLAKHRCVSCGAKIDGEDYFAVEESAVYQQNGFSLLWFALSLALVAALTATILFGVPLAVPLFDFEGQAGMMVALPVWFCAGVLVGLISPGRTFFEPALATLAVSLATAWILFQGQTVKTMPAFVYLLFCALGLVFTLVGAFFGEKIQVKQSEQDV